MALGVQLLASAINKRNVTKLLAGAIVEVWVCCDSIGLG